MIRVSILLTKTTAAQNEVALSYHIVRGLYFLAVVFVATIVLSETYLRFSVLFMSIRLHNKSSTITIGDSNTHKVYFNHEEGKRSCLSKEIYNESGAV